MPLLPLDISWPEIEVALKSHRNLVLVAEPGAGKTTRLPPLLLLSGLIQESQKILVLEPRRLAARAAALRIADERSWRVGEEVGYQVRFENRTSPTTRLQILTEGLLTRRLQSDPELRDVGAVILDEFHERSQHTDLALGLLFELQELSRPDLRIIVMSATLDADRVAKFLKDCPIIKVPGRTHPIEIHHAAKPLSLDTGSLFLDMVADTVLSVIEGVKPRKGDVLVFLPGAREIRGVRERIAARADRMGFDCFELHGSLALEDQDRAIRRNADGARSKIVLATNIAETSLTIDGVGTVIDSGLARVVRVDATGFPRLSVSRISLASATQRAGRSGRQGPGHSYRLWSKLDEASMPAFEQPELLRTDLSEPLLMLLSQGIKDPDGFSWFEKPSTSSLRDAQMLLTDLGFRSRPDSKGATGGGGELTLEGREALKLPLPVRLSRLMLEAIKVDAIALGAKLAALLSERDIVSRSNDLKRLSQGESDVLARYHLLESRSNSGEVDRNSVRSLLKVTESLEAAARRIDRKNLNPPLPIMEALAQTDDIDGLALRLLLLAFPDRIAKRRRAKEPDARLVGGRGVKLAPFSTVETAPLFLALDSSEPPGTTGKSDPQITIASRIELEWIKELFAGSVAKSSQIVFDPETLSVQKQTAVSFRDLPLEDAHISRPSSDEAFAPLLKACQDRWETLFLQHEDLAGVFARIAFLRSQIADQVADLLSNESLAEAENAFLEEACFGETKLADVLAKPLSEIYLRHLPQNLSHLLNDAAPDFLTVPSGSRIRIHYPENRAPYLEVRIQEIFGLRETPRIAKGRIPIVLHLLGPNYRPMQVTSDLLSFWSSGYKEVRSELRARYPKHSWPDDPLSAVPVAKGRRRQ